MTLGKVTAIVVPSVLCTSLSMLHSYIYMGMMDTSKLKIGETSIGEL